MAEALLGSVIRKHLLAVLLLAIFLAPSFALGGAFTGSVVKVVDGDTIDVLRDGKAERIRLAAIDCPERGQDFGGKATKFVISLAAQQQVVVVPESVDKYGRTVAEVFLTDGRSVNREIVKEGYGWWYRQYSDDLSYEVLESQARAAQKGLWSAKNPIPPWDWRHGTNTPSKPQALEKNASSNYHGNVNSHIFHGADCRYFNCRNCVQEFSIRDDAIAAGYRPCKNCKP